MSQNDNFFDEVTEEVRRDKLFILLKRYGWIGLVLILLIVASSVTLELRSNQKETSARILGDELSKFFLSDYQEEEFIDITNSKEILKEPIISTLVKARASEISGREEEAISIYRSIANLSPPSAFTDFSKFKLVLLLEQNFEEKSAFLEELISPDSAFFLLALEQKALLNISVNNFDSAKEDIELILNDPKASTLLRSRINKLAKVFDLVD